MTSSYKKQKLFCPGPVNVAENVKNAVFNEIGHREKDFSKLLDKLNNKTLKIVNCKNRSSYFPLFITGSGTVANEAVFSSLPKESRILILSNGEFGERLFDISSYYCKPKLLRFEWGEQINFLTLERMLESTKFDFIAIVHHETSTGMLNNIERVGNLAKGNGASLIVDCVSSLGAERIDLDKANVSFLTSSAGKALGALPGIGIIVAKQNELKKLKDVKPRIGYLSLYKLYVYSKTLLQTPNTPAVQLFFALETAVSNLLKEGAESRRDYIRIMAEEIRRGIKELSLEFLLPENQMCSVLTTVKLPNFLDFETLRSKLLQKNIVIYNGKGPLSNHVFQVATIGQIKIKQVQSFIDALGRILNEAKPIEIANTDMTNHIPVSRAILKISTLN